MNKIRLQESALIVVDAQRGFSELCPEELPVPTALQIIPAINQLLEPSWRRIDATQDWHPFDHCSFLGRRDNLYPPHCVMDTHGADFLPGLNTERFHTIWRKGFDPNFEAYAITAQHPQYVDLLRSSEVSTCIVCGIATNICCYATACDLRKAGMRVLMVEDASAGLDVPQAGLIQEESKCQGVAMGMEYCETEEVLSAWQ